MNNNDIDLLKESIIEYCENIYVECLGYMKKNNIDINLTGNDQLTIKLKNINNIKEKVISESGIDELLSYKDNILNIGNEVGNIVRYKWKN